jgi:hypothetical protein
VSGRRVLVAWLLLLLGAGALVASAFLAWQDDLIGLQLRVGYLWQDSGPEAETAVGSVGAALIVLAASALLGGALSFRLLTGAAGVLALAITITYVVHRAMLAEPDEYTAADVLSGSWAGAAGGLLLLAAALLPRPDLSDRVRGAEATSFGHLGGLTG